VFWLKQCKLLWVRRSTRRLTITNIVFWVIMIPCTLVDVYRHIIKAFVSIFRSEDYAKSNNNQLTLLFSPENRYNKLLWYVGTSLWDYKESYIPHAQHERLLCFRLVDDREFSTLDFKVPDIQMVKLCSAWSTEPGMLLLTCSLQCLVTLSLDAQMTRNNKQPKCYPLFFRFQTEDFGYNLTYHNCTITLRNPTVCNPHTHIVIARTPTAAMTQRKAMLVSFWRGPAYLSSTQVPLATRPCHTTDWLGTICSLLMGFVRWWRNVAPVSGSTGQTKTENPGCPRA
jgi:hypothetical protein